MKRRETKTKLKTSGQEDTTISIPSGGDVFASYQAKLTKIKKRTAQTKKNADLEFKESHWQKQARQKQQIIAIANRGQFVSSRRGVSEVKYKEETTEEEDEWDDDSVEEVHQLPNKRHKQETKSTEDSYVEPKTISVVQSQTDLKPSVSKEDANKSVVSLSTKASEAPTPIAPQKSNDSDPKPVEKITEIVD